MDWYIAVDNKPKKIPETILIYKIKNKEIEANNIKGKLYDSISKYLNTLNFPDKKFFILRANSDIRVNIK